MGSEEIALLLKRASLAQRAGDKAAAIVCLQQVVARDPRHETAWVWLGGLLTDPQQAIICLQNALAINPDNEQAQRGLAWWREHLASEPSTGQAARRHVARAEQLESAGQPYAAIEECHLATALAPDWPEAWAALGRVSQALGWPAEAAFAYRQALAVDPKYSPARQALASLKAPLSRAGELLWSTDIVEREVGHFCASPGGQRLLMSSLAPGETSGRSSGRLHLVDRCGNLQTVSTNYAIQQAGLSEDGTLVYAGQAARTGALIAWIDPHNPAQPAMQYVLQAGPPVIWKRPDDVLVVTSRVDPLTAVDMNGLVVWQLSHGPCDSIRLQPSADAQNVLVTAETLHTFTNDAELDLLTAQGQILWHKTCRHWLSASLLEKDARVLVASTTSLEAVTLQGTAAWQRAYKNLIATYLSPAQDLALVQYEHGNALEAVDTQAGRALWQRAGLAPKGIEFAALGQPLVLILHDTALLEALDAQSGSTLWQADLARYAGGPGRIIPTGDDWAAVVLGQTCVMVGQGGRLLGSARLSTDDIAIRPAPRPAAGHKQARGVIVTEAGRRLVELDRAARPTWEQAVPCQQWLAVPRTPYLAALGRKSGDRYTLSMLRWE